MATRSPVNPSNTSLATPGNYTTREADIGKAFLCFSVIGCSLFGNMVILLSYCQNYKMRTKTNTMIINNCLTDILIAVSDIAFFCTPTYVPSLMGSDVFCALSAVFDSLFKVASFLSMFCIAVGRHIDLVRGCRRRLTKERVAILIAWIWLQASLVAAPWNKLLSSSSEITNKCVSYATLPLLFEAGSGINALSIFFKTTSIVIPVLSIYYISYRVFSTERNRRRVDVQSGSTIRRRFSSQYFKATRAGEVTAMLLLGTYIVCSAPFLVAIVWTMFSKHCQVLVPKLAITVFLFFRLKGLLFPIIYVTRNRVVLQCVLKFARFRYNVPNQAKTFVVGSPREQDLKRLRNAGSSKVNCLNRRLEIARESKKFCRAKKVSLNLDFTDLKRAREFTSQEYLS